MTSSACIEELRRREHNYSNHNDDELVKRMKRRSLHSVKSFDVSWLNFTERSSPRSNEAVEIMHSDGEVFKEESRPKNTDVKLREVSKNKKNDIDGRKVYSTRSFAYEIDSYPSRRLEADENNQPTLHDQKECQDGGETVMSGKSHEENMGRASNSQDPWDNDKDQETVTEKVDENNHNMIKTAANEGEGHYHDKSPSTALEEPPHNGDVKLSGSNEDRTTDSDEKHGIDFTNFMKDILSYNVESPGENSTDKSDYPPQCEDQEPDDDSKSSSAVSEEGLYPIYDVRGSINKRHHLPLLPQLYHHSCMDVLSEQPIRPTLYFTLDANDPTNSKLTNNQGYVSTLRRRSDVEPVEQIVPVQIPTFIRSSSNLETKRMSGCSSEITFRVNCNDSLRHHRKTLLSSRSRRSDV